MHVLVINAGSSSIKFRLYDMEQESLLVSGKLERIGETDSLSQFVRHTGDAEVTAQKQNTSIANHAAGVEHIFALLQANGIPGSTACLHAIGHRVVHGGTLYRTPVLINQDAIHGIRDMIPLAPLHNAVNLAGIEVARRLSPQLPQVAVFDTAFFQTLPPQACQYALPYKIAQQYPIRRYGFHGISHQYVAAQATELLQQPRQSLRLITLHLGNGASAAAIRDGICIDTSMGMTPLEGLIMGTRCGDLDPAIPLYLARTLGMGPDEIETLLNQDSGMKGLCGSGDMRDIHRLANKGNEQARLAIDMYCYRIAKYCGAYYTALDGLDALVFTAGIGENDPVIRESVCRRLAALGVTLDPIRNRAATTDTAVISCDNSRVKVMVIPTNEELAIARQTVATINHAGDT